MLYLDTKIFMTTLNLTYNDKMSMASSVEVRVPFLDRELDRIPWPGMCGRVEAERQMAPGDEAHFREAMRSMLPEEVLRQPKAGFAAPVDYWLARDLRPWWTIFFQNPRSSAEGCSSGNSSQYVDEHRRGAEDWSMQIWQLLTLNLDAAVYRCGARAFASGRSTRRIMAIA